ncbi:uncharacterized protein LOC103993385 [Musa acuminata AAA Group]|uniref:uncharacterized protein LOC103993385 n=1 Tax=Musa acuminata AAA Group TaxID=214697 RepID=UPI0031DE7A64
MFILLLAEALIVAPSVLRSPHLKFFYFKETKVIRKEHILMPFLRSFSGMRLPGVLRQLEQDLETVITVLQPGPLGIIEHKFSAAEVQEAKAIVQSAVENWRRNSAHERNGHVWQQSKSATSQE